MLDTNGVMVSVPKSSLRRVRGHSFLPSLFPAAPRVVDCGANHGEFTRELADRYGAIVTAVEPNPALREDVDCSGAAEVLALAIADHDGTVTLSLDGNDEASTIVEGAHAANRIEVGARTLDSLLAELDESRIDLLKLDIEGAEISALEGLSPARLATIDQITVEFHDAQGWASVADIRRVCRRMRAAGFLPVRMSVRHWGDTLFVRSIRLSPFEQIRLCWWERPREFASRAWERRPTRSE